MLDILHKILYTGIGIAALSEEKAQEIVAELEKRGEVTSAEGKKLARDLIDKTRKQAQDIRQMVADEVKKVKDKMPCASRAEVDELKQRIADLEARCCPPSADDSL